MIDDTVKESYLMVNNWADREETDARKSEIRPKDAYQLAADLYNNKSFQPWTQLCPDVHGDFSTTIHLTHASGGYPFVSPDKIKDKLSLLKAKLQKVIADWETSGNGSGQRNMESHRDYGHVSAAQTWLNVNREVLDDYDEEFMDGDNRKSFLKSNKSHLLYM